MTQGYFEVSSFRGIPVALFDSHWFANRILETRGTRWMCAQIGAAAEEYTNAEKGSLGPQIGYAAMMPYRDFMAVYKREDAKTYDFLSYGFQLEDGLSECSPTHNFRVETAWRMLAAPPIRYCIPLHRS